MHITLIESSIRALRRPGLLGPLLALGMVAGCTDLLVTPAPTRPGAIAVAFHLGPMVEPGTSGGLAEALDRADRIRIRVEREGSPTVDTTLALPPPAEVRRVGPLTLQMRQAVEAAGVAFDVLRGTDVLFEGSGAVVELRAGTTTEVEVELTPVPAGVHVSEPIPDLTSLGDTVYLDGAVVFATGDRIPGLGLAWSTLDPTIVEVTPEGQLVALAEGDARLVATFEDFSDTLTVRVRPVVETIELTPSPATLLEGETLQLTAVLRDARGNPLPGRVVESWASSDEAIARVDGQGLVTAVAEGEAEVTATFQGVSGITAVRVVEREPIDVPGRDVVVFNDINIFDAARMQGENNVRLVRNLVRYTTSGIRNPGTVVIFDRGRNSRCGPQGGNECGDQNMAIMRATIADEGFTISDIESSSGTLTSIAPEVKVIFLWTPLVAYTTAEVNTLKRFAAEGGRIVFIGEHQSYYGAGIAIENQFLSDMGAVLRNTGGSVDCGHVELPQSSLREHQVTAGLTGLAIACASVIEPGEDDFPLFYSRAGTQVLAGVAKIDLTPIVEERTPALGARSSRAPAAAPAGVPNPASSTGH